ncbi:MAG: glycosyltransferase, partial [Pseudomonadota bacterium]
MQTDRVVDPTRFDAAFYLSEYPDVARSGLDPETHYRTRGWREGRDPSPFFSTDFYLDTYADIRAAGIEPLAHYAAHGREEGRAISPSRSLHGAVLARLDAVLAAEPAPAALPQGDADLLMASRFFHAAHYAQVSGQTGPRETLIAEYLSRPLAARPATHPQFCAAFYRETYLSDAPETDPLIDYLRTGRARNRYATPLALARDARLIKAGSGFDTRVYARSLTGPQRFDDAVKDYLLHGQERGGIPAAGFDGAFVTRTYLRPREIACAPYAYYLRNRARPWVFASLAELFPAYCEIVQARLFDPAYYTQVAQIDPAIIDPALHYLLRGVPAGLPCGPAFHTGFYLQRHPDIAAARINPLVHFEQHGAGEGRVAVPPSGSARIGAGGAPSPAGAMSGEAPGARPRAIVVSHEASMTGAPIVALNVARGLAHSHEVIVWLGKEGPLSAEFAACAAQVIHGIPPVGDALGLLKNLAADGPVDLAIVNSALSGAALEPLQRAGIPAILLVHDFATYVYPRGTLSRLVLNAPVSVFPAQVVADAQAEELSLLGAPAPPPGVQIAHQGWNGAAQTERATLDVDAIRAIIGAPDGGGQRVLFGGGWVQPRKGVDLFVQTAARLAREGAQDWRFVWVGGNYRPESDMLLSVYLADHVARAGLAGRFFFFDEQPDLEPFWELADIFLLSSRLDPYPNIALDALMRDVPVVCFDGATGIAELAAEFGFAVRPVPLADPADAADAISDLAAQPAALARAFAEARPRLAHELSFQAYIERLLALADTARAETKARAEQADLLAVRPMAELRAALATAPSWARIAPIDTPHAMALSIAALSAAGGPVAPLSASPGAPVELYPDHDPLVRLGGRDAGAPPDPGRWHVHLHLPPGAVLPEAVAPLAGLATVLLSSPLGALAQDALDPLP